MSTRHDVGSDGPPIPNIRIVGTTWYHRGVRYWLRRAGFSLFCVLLLLLISLPIGGLVAGVVSAGHGGLRVAILILIAAGVAWSLFTAARAYIRTERARRQGVEITLAQANKPSQGRMGFGLGVGVGAYGGSPVAGALLMIGAVFAVGWIVMLLLVSFRKYLGPEEADAVRHAAEWKTSHGATSR